MALPKYRTSRANTHTRRSQWKAEAAQTVVVTTPDGQTVEVPQALRRAAERGYVSAE